MKPLKKVLHVEDDPSIRTIARLAIEVVGGLTLLSCEDGRSALVQVEEFSPDLILLDVMLPDMDGPAILKALQAQMDLAQTPVLFMTAKVHKTELNRFQALGAFGVIPKPFDPMTLAQTLREHHKRFHSGC
ncbi:response regulator [Allohahella marinimesophila]|uniref:Response regulator n=1 Tax=Allohahella marinimesophila TaxID=1054972 RepID=A0ABP7NYF7_9GAMM